jgi:hypothetical protein
LVLSTDDEFKAYKKKLKHTKKRRTVSDNASQLDDDTERRFQIPDALEEVKSKVKDSLQALNAIRHIQKTIKEDIKDHLEVINSSDFEVRKHSALIPPIDHLSLSGSRQKN